MLPDQVCCSLLKNQSSKGKNVGRKKSCFNQNSGHLGEKVDSCPSVSPKTTSKDSAGPWKFLRVTEVFQLITWHMEGQSHCHLPVCAGLSLFVFFRYCLLHMVCGMDEGSWRRDLAWINYLFFISTTLICEQHQHLRQSMAWWKDLEGVFGMKMSRAWGQLDLRLVTDKGPWGLTCQLLTQLFISLEIRLQFNWLEMFKNCHCIIFCLFFTFVKMYSLSVACGSPVGVGTLGLFVPSLGSAFLRHWEECWDAECWKPMSAFSVFLSIFGNLENWWRRQTKPGVALMLFCYCFICLFVFSLARTGCCC